MIARSSAVSIVVESEEELLLSPVDVCVTTVLSRGSDYRDISRIVPVTAKSPTSI